MTDAPPVVHWVRLIGLPVRDYLRVQAHHDAVMREMALLDIQAGTGDAVGHDLRALLERVKQTRPAIGLVRQLIGTTVHEAADNGRERCIVDFRVTDAMVSDIEALLEVLEDVDTAAADGRLLTPPAPDELVALRRWLRSNLTAQTRAGAPPSFPPADDEGWARAVDGFGVLAAVPDGVIAAGADGRIVFANSVVEDLLGWPTGKLVGEPLEAVIPPRLRPAHRHAFERYTSTHQPRILGAPLVLPAVRRDGTEVSMDVRLGATATEAGDLVVATLRPIEERSEDAEIRHQRLLETVDAVVWELDPATMRCTFVSPSAERLLGYPAERWMLRPGFLTDLIDERDRARVVEVLRTTAATGGRHPLEYRLIDAEGRPREIRDHVELVRRMRGGPRLVGLMVDITDERRRSERRLAHYSAARALGESGSVTEAAPRVLEALVQGFDWDLAQLLVTDRDADVVRWAASWSRPDVAGHPFTDMRIDAMARGTGMPGRVWAAGQPTWIEAVGEETDFPRKAIAERYGLRSGACFPVFVSDQVVALIEVFSHATRIFDEAELREMTAFAAQLGQFVERRRVEEEQRFHQALLHSQAEASLDGIMVASDDGRVLFYNQRYLELTGIPEAVLQTGSARAVLDASLELLADPDAFLARLGSLLAKRTGSMQQELEFRDGRILDSHTAHLIGLGGEYYGRAWFIRDVTERRRAEQETRDLANTLQASLLPPNDPVIAGLDVAAAYKQATAGVAVGGDFYDVFATADGWGVVMGDVCGKGPDAAQLTALVRHTARAAAVQSSSPAAVLRTINDAVLQGDDPRFCTVVYLFVEPGEANATITCAAGGHPLPLVLRADGSVEQAGRPGTLLGAFATVDVEDVTVHLGPGDLVLLFTDGVPEARRGDRFFGNEALHDIIGACKGVDAAGVVARVVDVVLGFQDHTPRDDIAVLALRVPPA